MPRAPNRLPLAAARPFLRRLLRLEVRGAEHIPRHDKLIIVANHARRFVDVLVLATATPRELVILGHTDLRRRPIAGAFARLGGVILVVPSLVLGPQLVAECDRVLQRGLALGIFPEGRDLGGGFARFQRGAAYLALRNTCAVVPAWIERGPSVRFKVVYGPPLTPGPAVVNRQTLASFTDTLQRAVLALRPSE